MPEWMHQRAEHILAKNPSMPKGEAFAIATQQMHALGKGPKNYGTAEGKATAKEKYDTPKDDKKTANPGGLTSPKMEKKSMDEIMVAAFYDELDKIAVSAKHVSDVAKKVTHAREAQFFSSLAGKHPKLHLGLGGAGIGAAIGGAQGAAREDSWKEYAKDHPGKLNEFAAKHPVLTGALTGGATGGALGAAAGHQANKSRAEIDSLMAKVPGVAKRSIGDKK